MNKAILTLWPDHGDGRAAPWPQAALVLAVLLAALLSGVPAAGQPGAAAQERYGQCLGMVERDPDAAAETARAWIAEPDADRLLATHCLAIALVEKGRYAQAATALQGLVGEAGADAGAGGQVADAAMLQELRTQTGHAWMLAQQPDLAEAMFTAVLTADGSKATQWVDRARARADRQRWQAALSDLDHALRLDPENARVYALRASAWRRAGDSARALEDVELALALAPRMPEALLERGILRHDLGDLPGAREDWLQLRLTAPDSAAAEAAGQMLESLDRMPDE